MDENSEETKPPRRAGRPAGTTTKRAAPKKTNAQSSRANGASSRANGQTRAAAKPARGKPPVKRSRREELTQKLPSVTTLGQIALGAAAVVGAAVVAWQRYREYLEENGTSKSAFHRDEDFEDNFEQTRAAGPDAMRDHPGDEWDEVDQQVDESFPASDPPGSYAGPPR